MTVKELIEKLKEFPENYMVVSENDTGVKLVDYFAIVWFDPLRGHWDHDDRTCNAVLID